MSISPKRKYDFHIKNKSIKELITFDTRAFVMYFFVQQKIIGNSTLNKLIFWKCCWRKAIAKCNQIYYPRHWQGCCKVNGTQGTSAHGHCQRHCASLFQFSPYWGWSNHDHCHVETVTLLIEKKDIWITGSS